jgi:hypothetical protein
MNNTDLKKPVMRRVYIVYAWRKLGEFPCLECFALVALTCFSMLFVSVKSIILNFYHLPTITAYPGYFLSAFLNTQMVDKLIAVTALLVCGKIAWETSRGAARVSMKVGGKIGSNIVYFAHRNV